MIRGVKLAAAVGMIVATNGIAQAGHGHHGHGHGHGYHRHGHGHHHGHYGPRFGLVIAPPPVVAFPAMYPHPAYGYPAYVPAPVYVPPPAPIGLGFQTRNFSLFLGQ